MSEDQKTGGRKVSSPVGESTPSSSDLQGPFGEGRLTGRFTPPVIPDHELIRCIGRGSYGDVWLAKNVMNTARAVKIIYRDLFEDDRPYEREFRGIQMFEPISRSQESQLNILQVGRNDEQGYFYYVMELADPAHPVVDQEEYDPTAEGAGYIPRTLKSELRSRGRLPSSECLAISLALTKALEYLHSHELIHRDIKPANVIFVNRRAKLADLGLVTETGEGASIVGTEGYLPPEGPGQQQADIFSLGKTLYEIATGMDRLEFPQLPPNVHEMPDRMRLFELNEILLKACHHDRSKRYPSAAAMYEDLVLLEAGRSIRRTRVLEVRLAWAKRVGLVFTVLALLASSAFLYERRQFERESDLRDQAETAVGRQELQQVEQMFEMGESGQALALLAHRVRANPEDGLAARRLLSALTYRNFALPLVEMEHKHRVKHVDVSADGRLLASGTDDGELSIWELASGKLLAQAGTEHGLFSVAFHPDGRHLLSAGGAGNVAQLWRFEEELVLVSELRHPSTVSFAQFSPDGRRIGTVSFDGRARIWDMASGSETQAMAHAARDLKLVRFASDGQHLVTSSEDVISVWDLTDGVLLGSFAPHGYKHGGGVFWPETLDLAPNGPQIVVPRTGNVLVWDYERNEFRGSGEGHRWPCTTPRFSPDGNLIATGSNDQTVCLWDVSSGLKRLHRLHHGGGVYWMAFSPNGDWLASASEERTIRIWQVSTGEPITEVIQAPEKVRYLRFLPDGKQLLSVGDRRVWVWDLRPGSARPNRFLPDSLGAPRDFVTSVRFSRTGDRLMTNTGNQTVAGPYYNRSGIWTYREVGWDTTAQFWNTQTGERIGGAIGTVGKRDGRARLSGDGSLVIASQSDEVARIWRVEDGSLYREIPSKWGRLNRAALSPDGQFAVVTSENNDTILWDVVDARQRHIWKDRLPVLYTEFDPNSQRLLTVTKEVGVVREVPSGDRLMEISVQGSPTFGRFSPNGRMVVFPHGDRFRIYDVHSGEPITDELEHGAPVLEARFSPDGQRVVSGSFDQTAKVWDVSSGQRLIPNLNHDWLVPTVQFSVDGKNVATGSWDRTARIWDAASGLVVSEPMDHGDWVLSVAFHPDGGWLGTGSVDGLARSWELISAPSPVPEWVMGLAEALSGYRMSDQSNLDRRVDVKAFLKLKSRLLAEDNSEYYSRWGQWFYGDRIQRPLSPSSTVLMGRHFEGLLEEDSIGSLEELLGYDPMNPNYLARLARKLSRNSVAGYFGYRKYGYKNKERAGRLSRLATALDPNSAFVWLARAEVLVAEERWMEAGTVVARAAALDPREPNVHYVRAQIFQAQQKPNEAYLSFREAIDLAQESGGRSYLNEGLRAALRRRDWSLERRYAWLHAAAREQDMDVPFWEIDLAMEDGGPEWWSRLLSIRESQTLSGKEPNPLITRGPRSQRLGVGDRATLDVEVANDEPLVYQWLYNDSVIAGATNVTYTIPQITLSQAGQYSVLVRPTSAPINALERSHSAGLMVDDAGLVYGGLKREVYREVVWRRLETWNEESRFSRTPDAIDLIHSAEQPEYPHEGVAVRLSGYVIPEETGEYVFQLCSDDEGELYLGLDESPEHKQRIAWESSFRWARMWEVAGESDRSRAILLEAGKPYYLEARSLNESLTGYLGVNWWRAEDPAADNGAPPIAGRFLALPVDGLPPDKK